MCVCLCHGVSESRDLCQFLNSALLSLDSFQCTSAVSLLLLQFALLSQLLAWHCAALDGAARLTQWAWPLMVQLWAGAYYAPPAPRPAPAPPAAAWAAAWASMWQLQRQRAHPEMAMRRPRAGDNLKVGSYTFIHYTYMSYITYTLINFVRFCISFDAWYELCVCGDCLRV